MCCDEPAFEPAQSLVDTYLGMRARFVVGTVCVIGICSGCGASSQRPAQSTVRVHPATLITGQEVSAAFGEAGLPLIHFFGSALGYESYSDEATLDRASRAGGSALAWVEVDVFPSLSFARRSVVAWVAVDGAEGIKKRRRARIANVVVTVEPEAGSMERSRVAHALRSLRRVASAARH